MEAMHVLTPVFVHATLTFFLLVWGGQLRAVAVRSGVVRSNDIADGQPKWPTRVARVTESFHNQLELPLLFYIILILSLVTARVSATLVVLAWIFVATRLLHAFIHIRTNNISHRFFVYYAGVAILAAMWVTFALNLYLGGPT